MLIKQHGWDAEAAAEAAATSKIAPSSSPAAAESADTTTSGSGSSCGAAAALGRAPGLTITSFHLDQLVTSRRLLPAVQHAWLIQEWSPDLASPARAAAVRVICPRANALTRRGVEEIKAAGFLVRAWGVRDVQVGGPARCGGGGKSLPYV